MPLNDRGSLTPFRLPPESEAPDELKKPVQEYRELLGKRHAAYNRIGVMENKRTKAIEADRLALARALREGKDDPGDKSVEKIDKDLKATRRIIESLEIAIEEAEQELIGVVDDNQAAWLEDVDESITADAQEYVAAIEAVETARTKLTESVAMKRFLRSFPEHGYSPGHWHVFSLISPNGDPFRWDQVIDALRKDVDYATASTKPKKAEPVVSDGALVVHEHELRVPDPGGSYVDRKVWGN